MPELPEVENVKRSLNPLIINQTINSLDIIYSKIASKKGKFEDFNKIIGKKIIGVSRRSKNLIIELEGDLFLLIHLKMTGKLLFCNKKDVLTYIPTKHDHLVFTLDNGFLVYNDVRKFGYVAFFGSKGDLDSNFEQIGVDALDNFEKEKFISIIKKAKGNIKRLFLSQKAISGLGNIYADEILFDSKISPTRRVETLRDGELDDLFYSILSIISNATKLGGSSISDYVMADGSRGDYAKHHKVYNRGGKNCYVCGQILIKTTISSRTTVYCSACQK